MAELNQRQIAHRRAMLAYMTQVMRRREPIFGRGYKAATGRESRPR